MLKIDLSALMPGDVLLIKYNDTYWHTMMVVSNGRLAHAPGPGKPCITELITAFALDAKQGNSWSDATLKERLHGFRFTGSIPHRSWAEFAEQWCTVNSTGFVTHYAAEPVGDQKTAPEWKNYPRYRGVVRGTDDGHNAAALPFGPDALFRTLKWAQRFHRREPFSLHRGTTCCAFVMACIQASFVNTGFVSKHSEKLEFLLKVINGGSITVPGKTGPKTAQIPSMRAPITHTKGTAHAEGALRANSNRGLAPGMNANFDAARPTAEQGTPYPEPDLASAIWARFQDKGLVDLGWDDIGLPPALQHDAKYMYSRTFGHVLVADKTWAPL